MYNIHVVPVRGYRTLVSTDTLASAINSKKTDEIVVLDCAFSSVPDDAYTEKYLKSHIPGAKFFDHYTCVTSTSLIPRSIPEPYCFMKKLRHFGVNKSTDVVVYDRKKTAAFAARVWWLLRMFGHDRVSILDGGLQKWIAEGRDVHSDVQTYTNKAGDFSVNLDPSLIRDRDDVKRIFREKSSQLVDARGRQYFSGAIPHSETLPGGHIPGAFNVPSACFYNEDGTYKPTNEIKEVFHNFGVDLSKPMVSMCRTGIEACSLASAAHLVGKTDVPVYYGSWMEWAQKHPDMVTVARDRTQG